MKLSPALAAALLAAPFPAAAKPLVTSAAACAEQAASQPRTVFDVVVSSYPTVFERALSIKQINRIRPVRLPPQAVAHGYSRADFNLRSTTNSQVVGWGSNGRVCVWIEKVVVNLTPDSILIYIPKEYPEGGCESNALTLHERQHEELFRKDVLRTADAMRSALANARNLPGSQAPIDAATPNEAYARLKREVDLVVKPIYDDLIKSSRQEQDALDSPETYRRLGESCPGWKRTEGHSWTWASLGL